MAKRSAEEGHSPLIAIIDLAALKGSVYSASDVIRRVKQNGDLLDMRYKGTAELLVWGEIPEAAISHILPYTELERLTTTSSAISKILRLEKLRSRSKVYYLHQELMNEPVFFDVATASGMGELADHFGLSMAPNAQITDFIHSLIDGFPIDVAQAVGDDRIKQKLGVSFLNALENNRSSGQSMAADDEATISAFVEGIKSANDMLNRDRRKSFGSGSRPGLQSRRRR